MERDTVVRLARPGASVADDPLLLVLRDGARRMLQQVIEAEIEAFLGAHAELEDARGAAWQHVTGTFRAFAEWASDANLALARHQGMREARGAPFHELDAQAIAQGSAAFTQITEWFDAE
jgi:hypothetical protein